MTGPSPDHTALGIIAADASSRPHPPAAWRRLACAGLAAFWIACGGGGGGESGSESPGNGGGGGSPLATEPVDLPPGQTMAPFTWTPSTGNVASYVVFVSRNDSSFNFDQIVPSADVQIPGVAGDVIRITVVAIGLEGDLSAASPPSVEIRFHPALPAEPSGSPPISISGTLSGASHGGSPSITIAEAIGDETPSGDATSAPSEGELVASDGSNDASGDGTTGDDAAAAGGDSTADFVLTRAVRERLLRADARLPLSHLVSFPDAGVAWLGARVESEVLPGLTLIATAERADGALRDLVWGDAAGQIYLSDGDAALEAEQTASTLIPAIQLGESERLVALADVDGDGNREWIVEETSTGDAWIRFDPSSGSTGDPSAPPQSADQPIDPPATARLVGLGEFDGQAGAELLWQNEEGVLALTRSAGAGPEILAGALVPHGTALIAIADLDGDGRDDLIGRDADGQLALGQTVLDAGTGGFWIEWSAGHPGVEPGASLVGTLDLDQDGRAELAWLVGDAVEIRAIGETTPRAFEF